MTLGSYLFLLSFCFLNPYHIIPLRTIHLHHIHSSIPHLITSRRRYPTHSLFPYTSQLRSHSHTQLTGSLQQIYNRPARDSAITQHQTKALPSHCLIKKFILSTLNKMVSTTTTFILSLLAIPIVSAGQHTGSRFRQARRHHARMVQPSSRAAPCEEASWQCNGSELQRESTSACSITFQCMYRTYGSPVIRMRWQSMDLDSDMHW